MLRFLAFDLCQRNIPVGKYRLYTTHEPIIHLPSSYMVYSRLSRHNQQQVSIKILAFELEPILSAVSCNLTHLISNLNPHRQSGSRLSARPEPQFRLGSSTHCLRAKPPPTLPPPPNNYLPRQVPLDHRRRPNESTLPREMKTSEKLWSHMGGGGREEI